MSERASHRKIKAVVGFAFGIILGIVLYMILDFALEYHWKHALIITSIATLFMALSLALTGKYCLIIITVCVTPNSPSSLPLLAAATRSICGSVGPVF